MIGTVNECKCILTFEKVAIERGAHPYCFHHRPCEAVRVLQGTRQTSLVRTTCIEMTINTDAEILLAINDMVMSRKDRDHQVLAVWGRRIHVNVC